MESKNKNFEKRFFWMMVGNYSLSLGIPMLRLSGFGTDPFSAMNLGVSGLLPISFGTWLMLFNMIMFIPIFFLDRKSFGVGALVNMFLLGYSADMNMWIIERMGITIEGMKDNIPVRVLLMLGAIAIIGFGVAVYTQSDLGAAPWDRIGMVAENLTHGKLKFKWVRVFIDCVAIVVGFSTGAVIGVATFFIGFCTGPLVDFFRKAVAVKLLGEIQN